MYADKDGYPIVQFNKDGWPVQYFTKEGYPTNVKPNDENI